MPFCPYLGEDHNGPFSDEHVFPDALGGTKDFSIRVSEAANSEVGSKIEGQFLNSVLVKVLRQMHDIESRSGLPHIDLKGYIGGGPLGASVRLVKGQKPAVRLENFIQMDEKPDQGLARPNETVLKSGTLYSFAGDDSALEELIKSYDKKGMDVKVACDLSMGRPAVQAQTEIDLVNAQQVLTKIGYAALCFWFCGFAEGDDNARNWRAVFMADRAAVPVDALHGSAFTAGDVLAKLIPPLADYQHAAVAFADANNRLVVGVTLFGVSELSLIALGSEDAAAHGLGPGELRIAIADDNLKKTIHLTEADLVATFKDYKVVGVALKEDR